MCVQSKQPFEMNLRAPGILCTITPKTLRCDSLLEAQMLGVCLIFSLIILLITYVLKSMSSSPPNMSRIPVSPELRTLRRTQAAARGSVELCFSPTLH